MEHLRGHRLTNAESELLAVQDLYTIDEDLLNRITDSLTGPYEREVTVPCDSCSKLVTIIDKMPAGCTRIGILHGFCSECISKLMVKSEENDYFLAP
jgi:hypothetical protein